VKVGTNPVGVAVLPDGTEVYVTNMGSNNVSVINTTSGTIVTNVSVGALPYGVSVTPDGKEVYVANRGSGNVSVINTTTNTVTHNVNVENDPIAFGLFIGPGNLALNITKVANPTTYIAAGQHITYTYNVTNTGTMPIIGPINITDNMIPGGQIMIGTSSSVLPPGQSVPGTATYTITQADLDAGSVTNLANATGQVFDSIFLYLPVTSNNASVTILAVQNPSLKIEKEVDPKTYFAVGDLIDYSFTVTNKGNVDIAGPITVTDSMFGSKQISSSGLAPGQSVTRGKSYLITPQDIDTGIVINSAFATGSFNDKTVTSNSDKAKAKFFGPTTNLFFS
jgi:uncharacterized repeat protein (TIGR01451 family)